MEPSLALFNTETAQWFAESIGTPTAAQAQGWPAIAGGGHVLISAPTGTGKTLSAFLVFIDQLKALARRGELEQQLYLIYISPLKALGNDIRENLRRPLEGISGPEIDVAIRTGDTTQTERRRMLQKPPHILITTPESLYLLLTSRSGQGLLRPAQAIILDELHAVINTKRGAHLMLSLARLDRLCEKPLQRIGLSATIEPLCGAGQYLASPDPVSIIAPPMQKSMEIQVTSPLEDMRTLPEGTIWPELARAVYAHCERARTVIVFVESRAQAERLAHGVNALGGQGFARTHHGCVSKEQRLEAEQQLRSGQLRVLCATSSMELGIDVGEVDLVLQIGFPATISSAMQRLGRAGHNPGRTSVMHMFPRTATEAIYCSLTATVAMEGGIEHSHPPRKCLDVVAQHLVSMAAEHGYTVDSAMETLARAHCFQDVTQEEVEGLLRMLAGDYEHQADQPARPRVLYDRIHGTVQGDAYSRMLALSAGGTIPDRGLYTVRLRDGTRLGELDEEFVFEARIGDKFLLGAFAWRILEIRSDSVLVESSSTEGAQSPFWKGDSAGRPYQTGLRFGALLRGLDQAHRQHRLYEALRDLRMDDAAANNAAHVLVRQIQAIGCLADDRTIVVEHFIGVSGEHQMMVHSVFGRRVNAGLALLVQEAARRATGMDVVCFDDDDGFLIHPYGGDRPLPDGLLHRLDSRRANALLHAMLPASPLFTMAFRYNASRALMMGSRRGKRQPLWVQRLRGAQALTNAVPHSDHPLMWETRRECLEDYWDLAAIEKVIGDIQSGAVAVRELHLNAPSPLSLPLRRGAEGMMMYDYFPTSSGVHRAVEQALAAEEMLPPAPEQLGRVSERRRMPQDEAQLHSLLMAEGDLISGEVDVPVDWLESLARNGRALYIEPGLWICAEQAQLYQSALEMGDQDAWQRIARRCLRFRGPQDAASLESRYFLPPEICQAVLDALVAGKEAVEDNGLFYHGELYSRAQRETIFMRRKQIETLPPERYASLLSRHLRVNASPAEQLDRGLHSLINQPYPPALWESVLLPARASGYRPQLLDELLSQGGLYWRMESGDKPFLSFHRYEDIDWNEPPLFEGDALPTEEQAIARALEQRGATFIQGLTGLTPGKSPLGVLLSLAERGHVKADSFVPIRQWLEQDKLSAPKRLARSRANASMAGRWELTRPLLSPTLEAQLEAAFDRAILLCRETAQGILWSEALQVLRIWEYTGRVRRGYFIRGLSGAQFLRETDYTATLLALQEPSEDTLWLNAADPCQPWGKSLPHTEGRAFMNLPGTAVALHGGIPVAVLERNGHTLRVFDMAKLPETLRAFRRDYQQKHVFATRPRITIKQYPKEVTEALEAAGFSRQMLDYELWQKRL